MLLWCGEVFSSHALLFKWWLRAAHFLMLLFKAGFPQEMIWQTITSLDCGQFQWEERQCCDAGCSTLWPVAGGGAQRKDARCSITNHFRHPDSLFWSQTLSGPIFTQRWLTPTEKNVRCLDLDMLYVCNKGASGHNGFHVLLDWNSPKKTGEWGLWVIVMILMIKGPTELFVVYWHWNHGKLTRQNWWISRVATFKAKLKLSLCDGKGIWNLKVLALLRKLQVQRAENALRAFCAHATIWT